MLIIFKSTLFLKIDLIKIYRKFLNTVLKIIKKRINYFDNLVKELQFLENDIYTGTFVYHQTVLRIVKFITVSSIRTMTLLLKLSMKNCAIYELIPFFKMNPVYLSLIIMILCIY